MESRRYYTVTKLYVCIDLFMLQVWMKLTIVLLFEGSTYSIYHPIFLVEIVNNGLITYVINTSTSDQGRDG